MKVLLTILQLFLCLDCTSYIFGNNGIEQTYQEEYNKEKIIKRIRKDLKKIYFEDPIPEVEFYYIAKNPPDYVDEPFEYYFKKGTIENEIEIDISRKKSWVLTYTYNIKTNKLEATADLRMFSEEGQKK